ncbi:MAG: hypothetical protein CMF59_18685 [Leptospiraceae bacterium]|nr:hypothetical protein [Leptospiraceae bacterium]
MIKIAGIGDIHTAFDEEDVSLFNSSDYDLILVCGDLPGRSHKQTVSIGSMLSRLKRPALMIPGNHDSTTVRQLLGEITGSNRLKREDPKMPGRVQELRDALGSVQLGGYTIHRFSKQEGWVDGPADLDIISARPHSMGGPDIGFAPYIESQFDVKTQEDSARRILELLQNSKSSLRLILAHNGPSGLGSFPRDIWGCDFDPDRGDFGDPDLESALGQAVDTDWAPQVVLAGHMHHALKGGGERTWYVNRNGIHYVNAARVPRIFRENGEKRRHHVRIELDRTDVQVEQIYW